MVKKSTDSEDTPILGATTPATSNASSADNPILGSSDPSIGAGDSHDRFAGLKDKYAAASDTVKNRYSAVKDRVSEVDYAGYLEQGRDYVRRNPGQALLISIGVGFVIGMLLRGSREDED